MAGGRSRSWKIRSIPARACWPMVRDAGELAGGCDELDDVGGEGEEGSEVISWCRASQPPKARMGDLADGRDGLEQRLVAGLEAHGPHLGAVDDLGGVAHPLELALLPVRKP